MKKIFLLLWLVLLGLSKVQAYQFEKNGIYYDIVKGKAVVVRNWSTSYTGDVVIPETVEYSGQVYVVDSIGSNAFDNCDELTTVRLPEGLKAIGENAFYSCSGLTSISFPGSLRLIDKYAFSGCSGLTSLSFPEGMSQIGEGAFKGCGRLETISFPSTMKSIDWSVFCEQYDGYGVCTCDSIRRIDIKDFSTWLNSDRFGANSSSYEGHVCASNAKLYIDGKKLEDEVVIPEGVTELKSHLFDGATQITSIKFPSTLVRVAEDAFTLCYSLQNIEIDDLNDWLQIDFGGSFCPHYAEERLKLYVKGELLTYVVLPESLTELKPYVFSSLKQIQRVDFPENLEKIGTKAFSSCNELDSVFLPKNLSYIGDGAFSGVKAVTFLAQVPPKGGIPGSLLVRVPKESLDMYKTEWPELSASRIVGLDKEYNRIVDVVANNSSSAVLGAIGGLVDKDNANAVIKLKVNGTVNSYDFMVIRNKLVNLRELDLSSARVVYCPYEHYQGYHSMNDSIPDYAFTGLPLEKGILPDSLDYIGYKSFSESGIQYIMMPKYGVREIGPEAYSGCSSLRGIDLSNGVKKIGNSAFYHSSKYIGYWDDIIYIPEGCVFIGDNAFAEMNLGSVSFPSTLEYIGNESFKRCGLETVKLPNGLQYIGSWAFADNYSLEEVRFPASVLRVGGNAFDGNNSIKNVYAYVVEPLELGQNTFEGQVFQNATLHVPETAYGNYYWDTQWSQFRSLVEFNEPYEYFYLNKDLVIDEETPRLEGDTISGTGEVQGPDADLNPGSGLVVEGSESQDLGDVHLKDDGNGNGASVIGQGDKDGHCNINAKNLHIDIQVEANRWYFFCFPYPIDKKNIKYDGSYVLRWYDGAERAQHGRGGWKDWAAGKLTAGVGYIFQGSQSGTLTFQVPDAKFDGENRDILLQSHGADEVQDAGWNFVGNPYTSYFDLQDLGYDYPVTIWNGWSYEAYNPQDDDYVLYPYQAFFVQKPNAEDGITFHAAHRKTKLQSEAARRANVAPRRMRRAAGVERRLVNLTLSDGKVTDKTRVVFNARKRETYEVGCDAAKFMAEGVPQLYSLDGQGVKYAINERPEGNGVVSLGYEVQAAGNYTIGLTRADVGVMLKDKLTGASHDFSEGDYVFSSEAGTFHDRFLLVKSASATGVNGVFAAGEAVVDVENGTIAVSGAAGLRTTVTALSGILMGIIDGNGSLDVRPGVYVVNVGGQARKVVVR